MMYNHDSEPLQIETAEESNLTYKEVWETLSKIDVSPYLDTKGQFSYLSWSYARAILSHFYPQYRVMWLPSEKFEDGTMMLHCRVEIDHLSREHWLPVYDNKYNAIANPNADDIQDNMQRAFVKTICLFGLGIHLGEIWYLSELAGALRKRGRSRFFLTAPPLRMPGAVGSPTAPIATI